MRLISYRYEDSIKIIKQRYYCAQKNMSMLLGRSRPKRACYFYACPLGVQLIFALGAKIVYINSSYRSNTIVNA